MLPLPSNIHLKKPQQRWSSRIFVILLQLLLYIYLPLLWSNPVTMALKQNIETITEQRVNLTFLIKAPKQANPLSSSPRTWWQQQKSFPQSPWGVGRKTRSAGGPGAWQTFITITPIMSSVLECFGSWLADWVSWAGPVTRHVPAEARRRRPLRPNFSCVPTSGNESNSS